VDEDATAVIVPSCNAGRYLCNFLLFVSLVRLSRNVSCARSRNLVHLAGQWRATRPFLGHQDVAQEKLEDLVPLLMRAAEPASSEAEPGSGGTDGAGSAVGGKAADRRSRHSLFIHVLDDKRCAVPVQARVISEFLRRLVARLCEA
jgi:hypothetical protein